MSRYQVTYIGAYMSVTTIVEATDDETADIEATELIKDYYGINLAELGLGLDEIDQL